MGKGQEFLSFDDFSVEKSSSSSNVDQSDICAKKYYGGQVAILVSVWEYLGGRQVSNKNKTEKKQELVSLVVL